MKALGTYVILKYQEEQREGALIITTDDKDKKYTVVSVGDKVEIDIAEGDKVVVIGQRVEKAGHMIADYTGIAVKL